MSNRLIHNPALEARKCLLKALIADLQVELSNVEETLRKSRNPSVSMNQTFFESSIVPVLSVEKTRSRGLNFADLFHEIETMGVKVKKSNFRVFLSRLRDKGMLEYKERPVGPGFWRLASRPEKGEDV